MTRILCAALALVFAACSDSADNTVQGVSSNEIVIGTHIDLSGPIASWGVGIRNGMQMAVDEVNARGGVHGRKIRFLVEDNGYDSQKAALAARKLVTRDKIFAMIGAIGSPPNTATIPFLLEKNVFNLFPIAAAHITYDPQHPLKFVNETPMGEAIHAGVRFLVNTLDKKRIGILYQDDDYGIEILRGAKKELARLGMEPVSVTSYKRGATDFSAQIARARADGADALVLATVIRETAGAARAAQALGWNVPMICPMGCYAEETAELAPMNANAIYAVAQVEVPYEDSDNPGVQSWRARYERQYGIRPNIAAMRGTMSMRLFVAGLEETGRELTPERLTRALEDMPAWSDPELGGVRVDYSATDHIGVHQVFIAQLDEGRWKRISAFVPALAE